MYPKSQWTDELNLAKLVIFYLDDPDKDLTINEQHMWSLAHKIQQKEEMRLWNI